MRRSLVVFFGVALLAASGAADAATPKPSSKVWLVKYGDTAHSVRVRLGAPFKVMTRMTPSPCWIYPASKPSTAIDYIYFCFGPRSRVARIMLGAHG